MPTPSPSPTLPPTFDGIPWPDLGAQLYPAIVGAVLGAVLAAAVASFVAWLVQRRTLRQQLALRMAQAAYTAYRRPVEYWRWSRYEPSAPAREAARQRLLDQWVVDRVELDSVQRTIDTYFGENRAASSRWHQLRDTLTVFYLLNSEAPTVEILKTVLTLSEAKHSDRRGRELANRKFLEDHLGREIEAAMKTVREAHMLYRIRNHEGRAQPVRRARLKP